MSIVRIAPQVARRCKIARDRGTAIRDRMGAVLLEIRVIKPLLCENLVGPAAIFDVGVMPALAAPGVMHSLNCAKRRSLNCRPIGARPRSGIRDHCREAIGRTQQMLIRAESAHRVAEQKDSVVVDVESRFAFANRIGQIFIRLGATPAIRCARIPRRRRADRDHSRGRKHRARGMRVGRTCRCGKAKRCPWRAVRGVVAPPPCKNTIRPAARSGR